MSGRRSRRGLPASCRRFVLGLVGFGAGVQRLAFLRAVAIDRQGLEAQLPALEVRLGDVLGRRVARHVDRLGDRAGEERLSGGHHRDVGLPGDAARAVARREGTIEDRQVLVLQVAAPFDRVVLVDVARGSTRSAAAS